MAKKVLVTGGLGFIGYHLCSRLLKISDDIEITIVDNLSSTRLDYSALMGRTNILLDDMRNYKSNGVVFDEIYHLASPVGSLGILERNGYIASDIIDLATTAARLAAESGARLLYVSSSEVYGRNGQHKETAEQIVPPKRGTRMEYAIGKLASEHVLLNLAVDNDFELRVVRPFNAMGEWQSAELGFVIPRFFEAALNGHDLEVFGDGVQKRSFCHISDLVNGIIKVQTLGEENAIYNVGHPDNVTTIHDLAKKIHLLCRSDSEIKKVDPRQIYGGQFIEAFDKIPDIARVYEHTGWQPDYDLDSALKIIHKFYLQDEFTSGNVSYNPVYSLA